jgi:uncharacterized membrane protein YphA (DoxX/SURF4 family)
MNQSSGTPSESASSAHGPAASRSERGERGKHIALLVLQVVLGLFYVIASAIPKLIGHSSAVESFEQIGMGLWLMYVVGVLELAGGIALVTPRLSGLAALCLIALMVGAFVVQVTVFGGEYAATPLVLIVPLALIAWGRRGSLAALPGLLGSLNGRKSAAG